MKKYLLAVAVVFVAFVATIPGTASAQSPAEYTAEYGVTNLYTDDGFLDYYFAGLDVAEPYQWSLRALWPDGTLGEIISTKHSFGVATVTVTWDAADGDFLVASGNAFAGAAQVIDQYGQVQGTHFLLRGCNLILSLECSNAEWLVNGAAVSLETDRVIIGGSGNNHPLNVDGYFHIYEDPIAVLTKQGNISILHFRFVPGSTDEYRIYNKISSIPIYTIDQQDLEAYNTDDRNSVLTPYNPTYSFVVLNTNGIRPANINRVEDLTSWANGDNPHRLFVPKGAYDYVQYTSGGAWVSDGESTWLVGNNPVIEFWQVSVQEHVTAGGLLRQTFVSETEEIWDSGYNNHELNDSLMGLIDSTNYAYAKRRAYEYTVFAIQTDDVESTWSVYPTVSNLNTATLAHRRFDLGMLYNIDLAVSITDRAEATLSELGLGTPLGRTLTLVALMFAGFLTLAKYGYTSMYGFGMVFIAVGGAWIAIGLADGITTILFAISAITIIYMLVSMRGSSESTGM